MASSEGENVDRSFGAADGFLIYEVAGSGAYRLAEKRPWLGNADAPAAPDACNAGCETGSGGCGPTSGGCGGGASGGGLAKVALISDCRSLLCAKIGFQAEKQLARQAITVFDIECPIQEALDKITAYFDRVDQHQNLRGFARES